ncbi:MAG: hypothetical protein JNK85_21895 [Verrucomicrobiales bacterium]|nr:hypothetical protein [Verrucomicrobiales bacterium]
MSCSVRCAFAMVAVLNVLSSVRGIAADVAFWDLYSDTWVATDDLGRRLPTHRETGPPRSDRTVGMFYFLWHGAHIQGGPYDVTRILAQDPEAMQHPASPLWGPLHAPHHWGESLFGYYLTNDEGVLRKHAQMLGDAGVDVVIFDVTNQITYPEWYRALMRVWTELRAAGNRTPQVAFLTPFWDPAKVVRELWRDLYEPGLYSDLWFRWEGRPLILADPDRVEPVVEQTKQDTPVELMPDTTLGQSITMDRPFKAVGGRFPTWATRGAAVTLTLMREGPGGDRVACERFHDVSDNAWLLLHLPAPAAAGRYYLEASEPGGRIGWWSHSQDCLEQGEAFRAGSAGPGDRTLRWIPVDPESMRIKEFFTFRKPQPDYFRGPTAPDMWSWLEVHPQHVFRNSAGEKEQMSVGVAQNAVQGRLGSMSEPGAHGRSHHQGRMDPRPGAVRQGLNFAEQWNRVLAEDPRFVFVTGWNEWIAGRFAEFNGVKLPVMFVDQFDQEHSRDLEPMKGGHGDDYYYQMIGYIRRYKGTRALPILKSKPIRVDGSFDDWIRVEPEYRDTIGDPVARSHRAWNAQTMYTNATGRNDLVAAKVSVDRQSVAFLVRSREAFSSGDAPGGIVLYLDLDADVRSGWLGYEYAIHGGAPGKVERFDAKDGTWTTVAEAEWKVAGASMELKVRWRQLGLRRSPPVFDFKWAAHCRQNDDWTDFTLNGDAAPNDRYNYRVLVSDGGKGTFDQSPTAGD